MSPRTYTDLSVPSQSVVPKTEINWNHHDTWNKENQENVYSGNSGFYNPWMNYGVKGVYGDGMASWYQANGYSNFNQFPTSSGYVNHTSEWTTPSVSIKSEHGPMSPPTSSEFVNHTPASSEWVTPGATGNSECSPTSPMGSDKSSMDSHNSFGIPSSTSSGYANHTSEWTTPSVTIKSEHVPISIPTSSEFVNHTSSTSQWITPEATSTSKYGLTSPMGSDESYATSSMTSHNSISIPSPTYSGSTIRITLKNSEVWKKFNVHQNEMLVVIPGRRIFPTLELEVTGLDPRKYYCIGVHMIPEDAHKQVFNPTTNEWIRNRRKGKNELFEATNEIYSKMMSGEEMMKHIDLSDLKISNGTEKSKIVDNKRNLIRNFDSVIKVTSQFKYLPVVKIYEIQGNDQKMEVAMDSFPETGFIVVTSYKNKTISTMKKVNNKFCRDDIRQKADKEEY